MLIRSAVIHEYLWLAGQTGFDPVPFLERAGIRIPSEADEDSFIPCAAFARLLETTAAEVPCPDLGLRLAQVPAAYFEGPLIVLLQAAPTLRQAVELARGYKYAFSNRIAPAILEDREESQRVEVALFAREPDAEACVQATEHAVASLVRLSRMLTGSRPIQLEALFPHPARLPGECYERVLGCPAHFDHAFAGVRVPAAALDAPLATGSGLKTRMAIEYIESKFAQVGGLISTHVERLLRQQLGAAPVTQEAVASQLSIHVKTLQRRLTHEGTGFAELLDKTRRERFLELLSQPSQLKLGQIAHLLGYSEQAALSRSCQRWFRCSPSEMVRR